MTDTKHGRPSLRNSFVAFAVFLAAFYWLVVASYPSFFIFNPADDSWGIRQATLWLSLAGWTMIAVIPAVVLALHALGRSKWLRLLPVAALTWPISVAVNQILLYVRDGVWYVDYLVNHPIFIATDILLPALLMFLWWELREHHGRHELASSR